jgi:hypothetical protein
MRGWLQAGDDIEQGGFSTTAGAEDGYQVSGVNGKIDVLERQDALLGAAHLIFDKNPACLEPHLALFIGFIFGRLGLIPGALL